MGLAIIGNYVDWDGVSITEKQTINFYKKNTLDLVQNKANLVSNSLCVVFFLMLLNYV